MEFDEVKQKVMNALQEVLENDCYLLEHDINEPTISHRLAVYLEPRFPDFTVDCEYNGNVDADSGRKYIHILKYMVAQLGMVKEGEEEQEFLYRSVFPDIIVHKRGRNGSENNLLVVEIKKSSNKILALGMPKNFRGLLLTNMRINSIINMVYLLGLLWEPSPVFLFSGIKMVKDFHDLSEWWIM